MYLHVKTIKISISLHVGIICRSNKTNDITTKNRNDVGTANNDRNDENDLVLFINTTIDILLLLHDIGQADENAFYKI